MVTTAPALTACGPTGRQFEIRDGSQVAVIVELGATLRKYEVAGVPVLEGFAADEPVSGGRGAILLPWPNRIEDGRYRFAGQDHQLAIDDHLEGHAIHGLVRWVPWRLVRRQTTSVTLATTVFPRPGYPFLLDVAVRYRLTSSGLSVTTFVRNPGGVAAPFGLGHHPYLAAAGERIDSALLEVVARSWYPTADRRLPGPSTLVAGGPVDFHHPRPIGGTILSGTLFDLQRDARHRAWVTLEGTRLWMDRAYSYVMLFSGEDLPDAADHRRALAVEPMTCPPNAFRTGIGLRVLSPGETFRGRWGIVPHGLRWGAQHEDPLEDSLKSGRSDRRDPHVSPSARPR
jgi:aldose 1-epimerase